MQHMFNAMTHGFRCIHHLDKMGCTFILNSKVMIDLNGIILVPFGDMQFQYLILLSRLNYIWYVFQPSIYNLNKYSFHHVWTI